MTPSTNRTSATSPPALPDARAVDPAVLAWVIESCERQGVPVRVTDPTILARIAVLLGAPATAVPPHRHRPGTADTTTSLSA